MFDKQPISARALDIKELSSSFTTPLLGPFAVNRRENQRSKFLSALPLLYLFS
jgi:hypothetical protein